jgi:hypothetical protein
MYTELLRDLSPAANPKQGITVIETEPFSPTMETVSLAFDHATFPNLFRSTGFVSVNLALRGGEAARSFASLTATSGEQEREAKIETPGGPVGLGGSSHKTKRANIPGSKFPKTPAQAASAHPAIQAHSPDICMVWQDFAAMHSTSKPSNVEHIRQNPPSQKLPGSIYQNKSRQRIDPKLPKEVKYDQFLLIELRNRNLCTSRVLKGKCKSLPHPASLNEQANASQVMKAPTAATSTWESCRRKNSSI